MSPKRAIIGIALAAILLSLPFVLARTTQAQEPAADLSQVMSKLDQVLDGQRMLTDQMASIKQELNVIKIRVTQQQ